MSKLSEFWKNFNAKNFVEAQRQFDQLNDTEKQTLLQELFQKSGYQREPIMVSVLQRELLDEKSFEDFYQSWLPTEDMCNKVELGEQVFQQHFPTPVRVINGTNIDNPKDVISIGITWVTNKSEEEALWEYIKKAKEGQDKNNEARHDRIKEAADGKLLGLFHVETDDNLGTPF